MIDSLVGPAPTQSRAFLDDFAVMSTFGATAGGGVERLAGSCEDAAVRNWLSAWLSERGFTVSVDGVGNLFGLYEFIPGAPYVAIGSHLDSQMLAGRYDGAYGVLAAAHAAARLVEHIESVGTNRFRYNLAVVDWFNEEGARFAPSMMGSAVLAGLLAPEIALATRDNAGMTVAASLAGTGFLGSDAPPQIIAYAEIHVEQGRILEDAETTIGIVESTWAAHKFEVIVTGEQSHTGSTIIADRRDALVAAARLILAARALAESHTEPPALHTAVSELFVLPNSPVVVPREVRMNLDLRSPSAELIADATAELRVVAESVAEQDRVSVDFRTTHQWEVQPYQASGVALAASAASDLGLSYRSMQTIAGHDSTNMKEIVPTVMLFVPATGGIAHNEKEDTPEADCLAGVNLLTEVIARMTSGALDEN